MVWLKKITLFLVLFFSFLLLLLLYKKYQATPQIDVFNEKLVNENNQKVFLNSHQDTALIISFYASWCGDCIRELNDLSSIHTQLKNTSIICITDESLEKLRSFKTKKNYPFQFYKTEKSFSELDIHAIPVTYIINSSGKVVYQKVGAVNWKDQSFLQYAQHLLH